MITFNVTPVGKPRMTQRDKWKKRPPVLRYYQFKDEINLAAKQIDYVPADELKLVFYLPMPKSWSYKKRREMRGRPHQQKPDTDNLTKAFKDALCEDDSYIWHEDCAKYWDHEGRIEVYAD